MTASHLGDGDDGVRPRGVAGYQKAVAETIDEPGRPGHHVPIETVTDPDRRARRPKGMEYLG